MIKYRDPFPKVPNSPKKVPKCPCILYGFWPIWIYGSNPLQKNRQKQNILFSGRLTIRNWYLITKVKQTLLIEKLSNTNKIFYFQEDLERNDKRALVQSNLNRYLGYSWAIFYDSSSAADFANSFMQYGFENPGQNGLFLEKMWIT